MSLETDLIYTFVAFVLGIFFEEFLLEPILGPILRYRYTFLRKRLAKYITNHKVTVEVWSISEAISRLSGKVGRASVGPRRREGDMPSARTPCQTSNP